MQNHTITPDRSGPGSNGNERIFQTHQICKIEASPSDEVESDTPGTTFSGSNPSEGNTVSVFLALTVGTSYLRPWVKLSLFFRMYLKNLFAIVILFKKDSAIATSR